MKLNNQIGNKCKDTHTKTVNSCFSKIQSHFTFIKDLHFYLCFLSERSLMKILAFPKERAKIGNSSQFVLHQVIIEASHKLSSKSGTANLLPWESQHHNIKPPYLNYLWASAFFLILFYAFVSKICFKVSENNKASYLGGSRNGQKFHINYW